MFCRKCGRQLRDGSVFCAYCGSRTVQSDGAPQTGSGYENAGNVHTNGPGNYAQQPGNGHFYQPGAPGSEQYNCYNSGGSYMSGPGYGAGPANQGFYPSGGAHMMGSGMQMAAGGAQMAGRAVQGAGKAAGSAIRLKLTLLIAAALIAIAVMLYLLFFKAGTPEDTVQKMEDALNRMDQQALLECFDEQSQGIYSGLLGVGGELLNFDLGALSDLASGLGGYMSAAGLTPQFDLTVVDVEYTGDDTCLVTVDFAVTYQGTSDTDTQVLPMVKDGRDWVVSAAGLQ
ncbi:MAG TPA: zinc ribbon domain-containing protein [Candidatus Mediterraneibacter merdigallinarum]|nr:zinc ribbon domain-containing protein [Candidatus Mediterraneibacter merdigallinarum]